MFFYVVSFDSAQYPLCGFNRMNQRAPSPPPYQTVYFQIILYLPFPNREVFYILSHSAVFFYPKNIIDFIQIVSASITL